MKTEKKQESTLSGPNLDLLIFQQLDADPFCDNYVKLYFDVKHLEKGLNRGGEIFGAVFFFFSKMCPFWPVSDGALIF